MKYIIEVQYMLATISSTVIKGYHSRILFTCLSHNRPASVSLKKTDIPEKIKNIIEKGTKEYLYLLK